MCQNVPPLELHQNFLFQRLRPTWREAIIALVVRLHHAGDGQIADEWLLQGLLPRTRLPEFVDRMLGYGWLDRVNGKLCRAGLLAPSADGAEEDRPARSAAAEEVANTRAMKLNARLTRIENELGLAPSDPQTSRESPTNGAPLSNKSNPVLAQAQQTIRTESTQSPDKSDSAPRARPASPTDLRTERDSDGQSVGQAAARPELQMETLHAIDDASLRESKLWTHLVKKQIPPDVIREAAARVSPGEWYKLNKVLEIARNILLDRRAVLEASRKTGRMDMLEGAVPGGAAGKSPPVQGFSNGEIAARVRAEFEGKAASQ